MAGTGLINEALDDLATTLATISGVPAVRDPRNITPGCVLIGAPSFTAWNYNIVELTVPCTIISSGPGNQDALDQLLSIVALVMSVLATLYPSWRAARTQPAEALRYE